MEIIYIVRKQSFFKLQDLKQPDRFLLYFIFLKFFTY